MKNSIRYSPEALRDLEGIRDYIVTELCNPDAAEHVVFSILDAVSGLEDFAEMGALLSPVIHLETDYRYLVSGNYLIFYRVLHAVVYVDRILYSRRDILRILFGEKRS